MRTILDFDNSNGRGPMLFIGGFKSDDFRIQFSFKYNFSKSFSF